MLRREELKEVWSTGGFSGPAVAEIAIRNAAAVGASSVYHDILNITYKDLEEATND